MGSLTPEAIDTRAAAELGKIKEILWDFEFAECAKYIADRNYEAVTTQLRGKVDEAMKSFATDVMAWDDLSWSNLLFRRRVRKARKRYEEVSRVYGSWSLFMTRFEYNTWD